MKSGLTLVQLATEIERQANAKKDYIVDTKHASMVPALVDQPGPMRLQLGEVADLGVNKLAHRQIGEHVGIPAPYYDRMLEQHPDLLAANVNRWLKADPEKRMVRAMDGNARAFLSDRYRPLENFDLAQAVLPVLMDMDIEVMSAQITEQRLYIKAVHKSIRKDMPVAAQGAQWGDGSHHIFRTQSPGIVISNSETGSGALSVEASIFDHVCTNLAVFGQHSLRKYHTGAKHTLVSDQLVHLLSDETRRKTDEATWAQIRDVVKGAFDEAQFGARVDQVAGLQALKIEGDPVKVVEQTAKRLTLTMGEGKSMLRHFIEGGQLTAYGLYNALTRTAEDSDNYDRASEMERMGGKLVELHPSQWKELAKAA